MSDAPRVLIAGLGSDWGDDRLGWVAVRRLHDALPQLSSRVLRSPTELLDHLADIEFLHVVDACRGAGPPGSVHRFNWPSAACSQCTLSGTHDFNLTATLEIAERLGCVPRSVTIWAIEVATSNASDDEVSFVRDLTPAVAAALDDLLARLCAEVNHA